MPALPAVPSVVRVRIKGTISGVAWNNIHYLQYAGAAPTVADLNTVGGNIVTAWQTQLAPLAGAHVLQTGIELADLTNAGAAQVSGASAGAGTRAGTALTNASCAVISWPINLRYRGGHPRTYFPGGMQADVTGNRLWTQAFVTALQAGAAGFRTALNAIAVSGTTYKLVAVSYYTNHALRPTPLPVTINIPVVHGRVDSQRHRLGRETP